MIVIKEEIIISQDEPFIDVYTEQLTKEEGWIMTENTVVRVFKRERYLGIARETE